MATNSSPGATVRESMETPTSSVPGGRPAGAATPRVAAIWLAVHRIASPIGSAFDPRWCKFTSARLLCVSCGTAHFRKCNLDTELRCRRSHFLATASASRLTAKGCPARAGPLRLLVLTFPRSRNFFLYVAPAAEDGARLFAIVEFIGAVAKNLIILVFFSGEGHEVAGLSFVDDAQRIFAARIITGQNDQIAERAGRFAHGRPRGAIAFAASAENGDDAAGRIEFARGGD